MTAAAAAAAVTVAATCRCYGRVARQTGKFGQSATESALPIYCYNFCFEKSYPSWGGGGGVESPNSLRML